MGLDFYLKFVWAYIIVVFNLPRKKLKKKENQICENIKLPNRKFNNIYDKINFNIPSLMFIESVISIFTI